MKAKILSCLVNTSTEWIQIVHRSMAGLNPLAHDLMIKVNKLNPDNTVSMKCVAVVSLMYKYVLHPIDIPLHTLPIQ